MNFIPLEDLQVVGYTNQHDPNILPAAAQPVFRTRCKKKHVVLPPYQSTETVVLVQILSTQNDLDDAVRKGEITLLARARAAKPNRLLWLDTNNIAKYEKITYHALICLTAAKRLGAEWAYWQKTILEVLAEVEPTTKPTDEIAQRLAGLVSLAEHKGHTRATKAMVDAFSSEHKDLLQKAIQHFYNSINFLDEAFE